VPATEDGRSLRFNSGLGLPGALAPANYAVGQGSRLSLKSKKPLFQKQRSLAMTQHQLVSKIREDGDRRDACPTRLTARAAQPLLFLALDSMGSSK
jgi:hypothetical protein